PVARDLAQIHGVAHENPGKPVQILVQRRNYDADGRPIEGALRRFPVTVTPLKKARWDLGLEFDEVATRITSLTKESPARSVLEPGDTLVAIDSRAVTCANLHDLVAAAGEAHGQGDDKLSGPISIVYERSKAGVPERRTGEIRLLRSGDGWQMGVRYAAD